MELICIGKIINTHGIRGEVKIESYSDFDAQRYRKGNTVYVYAEGSYLPFTVASYRVHKSYPLVAFAGLGNINDVEKYKGCDVFFEKAQREALPAGEYYREDLIGLTVQDTEGDLLGKVIDIEETNGAQNNLRIRLDGGRTVLVPYVPQFVAGIDTQAGIITIRRMEGLI